MHKRKQIISLFALPLVFAVLPVAQAQQSAAKPDDGRSVTEVAASPPLSELLPKRLAGVLATGEIKQFGRDNLAGLVGDQAPAYQEYRVVSAITREYGPARVNLFILEDRFAAFGLFSYVSETDGAVFYEGNRLVRISGAGSARLRARMAQEIAASIKGEGEAEDRPPLLNSLPREFLVEGSERYFLGPASVGAYVEGGSDIFGFAGDAEAVMAEYKDTGGNPLRLIIVEYHTPSFAAEGLDRASEYINSLPDQERGRYVLKREGNYIVQAVGAADREFAEQLMGAVEYPYTVKWLRDPLLPTNDPFRQQKAAEMLLSTFGILGFILLTVLVVGGAFGTVIFLRRRKEQQQLFSDGGGMLRLELDPFEATILGLPPKRSEQGSGIGGRGSGPLSQ
jgi:hypothetical protein